MLKEKTENEQLKALFYEVLWHVKVAQNRIKWCSCQLCLDKAKMELAKAIDLTTNLGCL